MQKNTQISLLPFDDINISIKRLPTLLWRPSLFTGALYILFFATITLVHHYPAVHYVHIGRYFLRGKLNGYGGYDGQFYYQIARDPWQAFHFMDNAAYRYQRILYPLIVYT